MAECFCFWFTCLHKFSILVFSYWREGLHLQYEDFGEKYILCAYLKISHSFRNNLKYKTQPVFRCL